MAGTLSERLEEVRSKIEHTDDADVVDGDPSSTFLPIPAWEFDDLLREAAELARRVEGAPRAVVWSQVVSIDEERHMDRIMVDACPSMIGKRVALVEVGDGGS